MEDGRLVGQDCVHVSSEGLHILADEDSVLLGLIPVGLEMSCVVKHRVLKDSGRTDRILLLGRLWWGGGGGGGVGGGMGGSLWRWWMGGGLASVTLGVDREAKPGLILLKLILIRGFIARVIHRFEAWYTRLVLLDRYSLYGVYPRLVVL